MWEKEVGMRDGGNVYVGVAGVVVVCVGVGGVRFWNFDPEYVTDGDNSWWEKGDGLERMGKWDRGTGCFFNAFGRSKRRLR